MEKVGKKRKKSKRSESGNEEAVPEERKLPSEGAVPSTEIHDDRGVIDTEGGVKKKKRRRSKPGSSSKGHEIGAQASLSYGAEASPTASFDDFDLDERLLKAVGELGWARPTHIQQNLIPLVLDNKNISARARTGSGKTAAYMLPIIQKVLQLTDNSCGTHLQGPFAIFIAPTKELAAQIATLLSQLTSTFPFLQIANFAEFHEFDENIFVKNRPDFVVSTPARLLHALKRLPEMCAEVRHVVLDEADLLLSFGYEQDMKQIKNYLYHRHQTIFTSATLTEDIGPLKSIFVNGPVITLKLKEGQLPGADQLSQYHIICQNDEERFAIFLAMIKLKLIIGKSIIFVSDTDRCYQLGLFLHAFQVRSCILNAQMPASSRCHVVDEFNKGRYLYVIASEISDMFADEDSRRKEGGKPRKQMDKESGVSRGIDFHHVSNVINFDFPNSVDGYIHRVGRTARGWNKGTALSFAIPEERENLEEVRKEISTELGCSAILPYEVRINELQTFVLRAREALAACTRSVVKEARLAEIRGEVLRSKLLEGYFAKNAHERSLLEHDKKLRTLNLHSPAIADVPDYMVPVSLRGLNDYGVETSTSKRKGRRRTKQPKRLTAGQKKFEKKMNDPLQSFTV